MGSSREQAVMTLRQLGVAAVVAKSFAGLFFRNALNLGLPALACADAGRIRAGDRLAIAPEDGRVENLTTGETYACEPIPPHLVDDDPRWRPDPASRKEAEEARMSLRTLLAGKEIVVAPGRL